MGSNPPSKKRSEAIVQNGRFYRKEGGWARKLLAKAKKGLSGQVTRLGEVHSQHEVTSSSGDEQGPRDRVPDWCCPENSRLIIKRSHSRDRFAIVSKPCLGVQIPPFGACLFFSTLHSAWPISQRLWRHVQWLLQLLHLGGLVSWLVMTPQLPLPGTEVGRTVWPHQTLQKQLWVLLVH